MEDFKRCLFQFKWHIVYLISGYTYCYFLNKTNEKLLQKYAKDDYLGMLTKETSEIIWSFVFALLVIVVLILISWYTFRNYYLFLDDVTSLIALGVFVILSIALVMLTIHLIYVPIFKAIMFGLVICGFIGTVTSSN